MFQPRNLNYNQEKEKLEITFLENQLDKELLEKLRLQYTNQQEKSYFYCTKIISSTITYNEHRPLVKLFFSS